MTVEPMILARHQTPAREANKLLTALTRPSTADTTRKPPATSGVPRDRYDRPLIHVPGHDKPVPYTRCTTFVDCIDDKTALSAWAKRMVLVGVARAPHLAAQASRLDPDDRACKQALNQLAEQATVLAGGNTKRERGTHLHTLSEYVDHGEPLPVANSDDLADMAAYKAATVHLDVVHVERLVVVDTLRSPEPRTGSRTTAAPARMAHRCPAT